MPNVTWEAKSPQMENYWASGRRQTSRLLIWNMSGVTVPLVNTKLGKGIENDLKGGAFSDWEVREALCSKSTLTRTERSKRCLGEVFSSKTEQLEQTPWGWSVLVWKEREKARRLEQSEWGEVWQDMWSWKEVASVNGLASHSKDSRFHSVEWEATGKFQQRSARVCLILSNNYFGCYPENRIRGIMVEASRWVRRLHCYSK